MGGNFENASTRIATPTGGISFTAGDEITMQLAAFKASNSIGNIIELDNVSLLGTLDHTPVPEPSSTALLGLGALGLLVRRKR